VINWLRRIVSPRYRREQLVLERIGRARAARLHPCGGQAWIDECRKT
jgi:hypothetical protein